jgi:hypothetical protein
MEMGKRRRCGVAIFRGKEGEEARRLHGAGGGWHSEERRGGWGVLKLTTSVWRSKTTKENWVSEKNIVESMRWVRKIREGILAGQNREKGNKNREGFFGRWKLEI